MKKDFSILKNAIYNIKKSFESFINEKFSKYNLTAGQAQFLHILNKENNLRQSSLTKLADCNKSYTHRIVLQLLEKKLIKSSNNNEIAILSLTEKGKFYAQEFEKDAYNWQDNLFKGINQKEIDVAKKVLTSLSQNAIQLINNTEKKK